MFIEKFVICFSSSPTLWFGWQVILLENHHTPTGLLLLEYEYEYEYELVELVELVKIVVSWSSWNILTQSSWVHFPSRLCSGFNNNAKWFFIISLLYVYHVLGHGNYYLLRNNSSLSLLFVIITWKWDSTSSIQFKVRN